MGILDDLPFEEVVKLYQLKNELTKSADLTRLIQLKKDFGELFIKENEDKMNEVLFYIQKLSNDPHFQHLLKQEKKEKFVVLDIHQWQIGMVDHFINQHAKINLSILRQVIRLMVKEAVIISIKACQEHSISDASVEKVFPFLGLLLGKILFDCPEIKRKKIWECMDFKLRENEIKDFSDPLKSNNEFSETYLEWRLNVKCYSQIEDNINQQLIVLWDKIKIKFDQRKEFYTDRIYFSLVYAAEFIGLMSRDIAKMKGDSREDIINRIYKHLAFPINDLKIQDNI